MDSKEILSLLREPVMLNGVPVKETTMFRDLSDLNLSEQRANDYICSLHKYLLKKGTRAAAEKILLVFRIHPLVAVRAIETSSLIIDIESLSYALKPLFLAISDESNDLRLSGYNLHREEIILNDHLVRYLIMLIEASFQNSICEVFDEANRILSYVRDRDHKLYKSGNTKRIQCLTNKNVKEIVTHIPENRQIDLINWFWRHHLYVFRKYGKTDTYDGRKVAAMLEVLPEGALWRNLENAEKGDLSHREQARTGRERKGIADFIRSVVVEDKAITSSMWSGFWEKPIFTRSWSPCSARSSGTNTTARNGERNGG